METQLLEKLLRTPKTALSSVHLEYVTDDKMPIARLKKGSTHSYHYTDGSLLEEEKTLERIRALVIPPAWQGVKITHLPNGHLQAVGRDGKRRKQYRYHPTWIKVRNQTKFYRMVLFGKALPAIRTRVDHDLEQKEWPRTKVLALVVRLMEETHIRIGNEQYAKRNKTYGLSTLRKRHVDITKNGLKFNFTGKRGKKHSVTLKNKKLIRLVGQCEEIPGWELFHYFDKNGDKHEIDSSMVNGYLKTISGHDFTAKDFRTWAAGVLFFNALMNLNGKLSEKNVLRAYDATAKALGNTRNVCRKSYVHPILPMAYVKGELSPFFERAKTLNREKENFSPSENAVLQLISDYEPRILKK